MRPNASSAACATAIADAALATSSLAPTALPLSVLTRSSVAVVDVSSYDPSPETTEIARIFLPDPARGTGDDDDLSLDVHVAFPPWLLIVTCICPSFT
jgi:hypothetical protein